MAEDGPDVLIPFCEQALRKFGTDPEPLASAARHLADVPEGELRDHLRAFSTEADAYETYIDSDYGAILLESVADSLPTGWRRQEILYTAQKRATHYASWSTSGGEGLARTLDVLRISRKLSGN